MPKNTAKSHITPTTATQFMAVASGGLFAKVLGSAIATMVGDALNVTSGTWTPTPTNTLNLDSDPTTDGGFYIRVGSIVACAATFTYNPTASGEARFRYTLPVSSDIGTSSDLAGVFGSNVGGGFGRVIGDSSNNAAEARINNTVTSSSQGIAVAFYRVI